MSLITSGTVHTQLPTKLMADHAGEAVDDSTWKKISQVGGHVLKLAGIGAKYVGSKAIESNIKRGSEQISVVSIIKQVLSGEISLEKLDKALGNVLSGSYNDEDLSTVSWLFSFEEAFLNEVNSSGLENLKKSLHLNPIQFNTLKDFAGQMQNMSKLRRHTSPFTSSLPTAHLDAIALPFRCLSAMKMQGKFDCVTQSLGVLNDPQSPTREKTEAAFSLAGAAAAVIPFGLSFVTGTPSWVLTGLGIVGGITGLASCYFKYTSDPEREKSKKMIKADLEALKTENTKQIREDNFRIGGYQHYYSKQFAAFQEKAELILSKLNSTSTEDDLIKAVDEYSKARAELGMPQPKELFDGGKGIQKLLGELRTKKESPEQTK